MAGVFISYTTRGGVDDNWISGFRQQLEFSYAKNYGKPHFDFWDMSRNDGDFQQAINTVVKSTTTMILVLDPAYANSPQTQDEIILYQKERAASAQKEFFIKVIKRRGDQEELYHQIVNKNLVPFYFSKINPRNGIETEYAQESNEYYEEIEKIVKRIRKNEIDQRRKVNSARLLARMAELKDVPKIYVALGDSGLTENRRQFINELNGTILRHADAKVRQAKVLPDDVTFNTKYEELDELLCEENEYREACLDALLTSAVSVIFPFQTDNKTEGELYLSKAKFQLDAMKLRAQSHKLPLHLLLNIPEVLYTSSEFKNEFNSPALSAYQHIRLAKNQEILPFIEVFMKDLARLVNPPSAADGFTKTAKQIYLIEYDNPVGNNITEEELDQERINRARMRSFIEGAAFKVMPELPKPGAIPTSINLQESTKLRQQFIKESDGVIIYRGIREDQDWCLLQQAQTYREIRALKNEEYKRAVFIDPAQTDKDSYGIYDFKVIKTHPEELNQFLWQVQQH